MKEQKAQIGIIGGSGVYDLDGLENLQEVVVDTPYGAPSDVFRLGEIGGKKVAFLARHGQGHRVNPTNVPYRANIYGMKSLGVEWLISVSAVGSLKEELEPLHFVVPDQLIDRTRFRTGTFFDPMAVHIAFADPFCPRLSGVLIEAGKEAGVTMHAGGTYICMEGPAFSTRAESNLYRSWGADIIGMTALPEAKLAREAEICYGTIACVTDYDCWFEEVVTVDAVLETLRRNVENSKRLVKQAIGMIPDERTGCECPSALRFPCLSDLEHASVYQRWAWSLFFEDLEEDGFTGDDE